MVGQRREGRKESVGGIYKCGFGVDRIFESVEFIFCLSRPWNDASNFCQPFSLSLRLSPLFSIEKPPVSYYSPAVCHCARRTKRHGADPCLIRPKYSANIRMNARPKRQAGKVHGPGKDVLKKEGTRDTTMPPLIILAENAMQLIGRLVIAVNGDGAGCLVPLHARQTLALTPLRRILRRRSLSISWNKYNNRDRCPPLLDERDGGRREERIGEPLTCQNRKRIPE